MTVMIKPEYMIINEDSGLMLYRKLFPGEEIWYVNEQHRLIRIGDDIWLYLRKCECGEQIEL